MAKDDNLFEDVIKESSDLLDIELDDLTSDVASDPNGEEADDGIIELTDLVEEGDAGLFNEDDLLKEDISITDEAIDFPDEVIETQTEKIEAFDDMRLDADISNTTDDLAVTLPDEEISDSELSVDNLLEDSDKTISDTEVTGDLFDKLLDDTVLEELSEQADAVPEEKEEFNLEPEDFSDLESIMEEESTSDEMVADTPILSGVQGNLFKDFDAVTSAPEETHGLDDEQITEPDIFGDEPEKTIVSSDDDTAEKSLWGTDAGDKISDAETEGVSILEDTYPDEEKIEYSGMDSEDTGFVNIDDIQLDSKSFDDLFSDEGITADEPLSEKIIPEEKNEELLSRAIDQPDTSNLTDEVDNKIEAANDNIEQEIGVTDDVKPLEDTTSVPVEAPVQPVISEERIEEIVTKVVGEVVERVAREVFAEVAERVITEAIEGLKKGLEAELE